MTGPCFLADRVLFRFDAADPRADFFFAATFGFAATRGPRVRLVFVAAVLPDARFVVLDFRRVFPPDDFDRVAISVSSEGRYVTVLRKIRAQRRGRPSLRTARGEFAASQNHALVADCNRRIDARVGSPPFHRRLWCHESRPRSARIDRR